MLGILIKPEELRQAGPIDLSLYLEEFQAHWKNAIEDTSYSISGIHVGHYNSTTTSFCFEIFMTSSLTSIILPEHY